MEECIGSRTDFFSYACQRVLTVVTEACSCDVRNNINLKNHDMSQQNFVDCKNSECSLIF